MRSFFNNANNNPYTSPGRGLSVSSPSPKSPRVVQSNNVESDKLEGWLQKKGDKGAIKTWKARYFVQKGKKLFYYKSVNSEQPQGFIDLLEVTTVLNTVSTKEGYAFIVMVAKREYYLLAKTEQERLYWVLGLSKATEQWKEQFHQRDSRKDTEAPPVMPTSPRGSEDYGQYPNNNDTSTTSSSAPPLPPRSHPGTPSPPQLPPRPGGQDTSISFGSAGGGVNNNNNNIHSPVPVSNTPHRQPHQQPYMMMMNTGGGYAAHVPALDKQESTFQAVEALNSSGGGSSSSISSSSSGGGVGVGGGSSEISSPENDLQVLSKYLGIALDPTGKAGGSRSPGSTPNNIDHSTPQKPKVFPKELLGGETIVWQETNVCYHKDCSEASRIKGYLFITNYQVIFTADDIFNKRTEEVKIPLSSIAKLVPVAENTEQKPVQKQKGLMRRLGVASSAPSVVVPVQSLVEYVDIHCKDIRVIRLSFATFLNTRSAFIEAMHVHQPSSLTGIFAFAYRPPKKERHGGGGGTLEDGWNFYNPIVEYQRMGIPNEQWRIVDVNRNYDFCKTYPSCFVIPNTFPDSELNMVQSFRTKGRIPVCVYKSPNCPAVILRCSQPKVGIARNRGYSDELYFNHILRTNTKSTTIFLMDARPRANAMANRAKGAGYERANVYKDTKCKFLGIENIHIMRASLKKLLAQCHTYIIPSSDVSNDGGWNAAVGNWLGHLFAILRGAVRIVHVIDKQQSSAVIHCSDGWDRTSQLAALSELILDEFYRTILGFAVLIEKEFLSFGHQFADRCGHYFSKHTSTEKKKQENTKKSSPVFQQFIECVWQLTQMYPRFFEFNDLFLMTVLDHSHAGLYGTFLCNSERERKEVGVPNKTASLWPSIHNRLDEYKNPQYTKGWKGVLPDYEYCADRRRLQLWREYYFRYNPNLLSKAY